MMIENKKMIDKEGELIILLSKLSLSLDEITSVEKILAKEINLEKFIHYAFEHKVINIVYRNLIKLNLHKNIPKKWRKLFDLYYGGNKYRNEFIYKSITPIFNEFFNEGIKCVGLKGIMLNHKVYGDIGLRYNNDIDILLLEKDLNRATTILKKHGFIQGFINSREEKVIEATRKEVMFQRLTTHELIPLIKKTEDYLCDFISVDVQFDIFSRAKNMKISTIAEDLFNKAVYNNNFFELCHEHNLLQLCSHAFQDATMLESIKKGKDLELIKFLDIYEYTKQNFEFISWDYLKEITFKSKTQHIVYYSFFYTEEIFGPILPEAFRESIKPKDERYLHQFGFEEIEPLNWGNNQILSRLFNNNRSSILNNLSETETMESDKYLNIMKK